MTNPYATGQPSGRGAERAATVIAAVIALAAAVVVVLVATLSDDSATAGGLSSPVTVAPGVPGAPSGVVTGPPESVTGGASPSAAGKSISPAKLRHTFPFPPGTTRAHPTFTLPEHLRAFQVDLGLGAVRRYYQRTMPRIGIHLRINGHTREGHRIVGYSWDMYGASDDSFLGSLTISKDFFGNAPGTITIQWDIP